MKKIIKTLSQEKLNHHFIFIEAPLDTVFPEILVWGEGEWWPKNCPMRFIRRTELPLAPGTEYQIKVAGFWGLKGMARIAKIEKGRLIERKFTTGLFEGHEIVKLEERANGTRLDYEMHYKIKGLLNWFIWSFFALKKHDASIEKILTSLRGFMIMKYHHLQEIQWEKK